MGPQLVIDSFPGSNGNNNSGAQNNESSQKRLFSISLCCRRGRPFSMMTMVVLIAGLTGLSTLTLQFMASQRGWSAAASARVGMAVQVDATDLGENGTKGTDSPAQKASDNGGGSSRSTHNAAISDAFYDIEPGIDRRFYGQKTGVPPKPDEEIFRPPPSKGPFGWGTDWAVGVSLAVIEQELEEDVINPPWCAEPHNRSFVEFVMARRHLVNVYDKVASCVQTKDMGRYLPEWVAYHWALGVDEFMVYDDESVDDTREVLESFVRAGVVKFRQRRIPAGVDVTAPLNECVQEYRDRHDKGDHFAPRWLLLTDTNEYVSSGDIVSTLADTLATYSDTCCLKIPRVQYGSSGLLKPPRGLIIENFVMHADPHSEDNGLPAMVVNLRPPRIESGEFQRIPSPGEVDDCRCDFAPVEELAVNRYALTLPDYWAKNRLHGEGRVQSQIENGMAFAELDRNEFRSDEMLIWGCAVREVLDRVASGRHMKTNQPFPSLSPHHPVVHGLRPMDPFGVAELEHTMACTSVVQGSPTVAGTTWGNSNQPPQWLQMFCGMRYIFVHSFEEAGGKDVINLLSAHLWVQSHQGRMATRDGGATLSSAMPSAPELQATKGEDLKEFCGCSEETNPGCWRYCPTVQRKIVEEWRVNKTRRQLLQDWVLRFKFEPTRPGTPVVLAERDSDMLVASKQALFPSVSQSVIAVRHPFCTPAVVKFLERKNTESMGAGLTEWLEVWKHVLTEQLPKTAGEVWVVRFEDMVSQEVEAASALWAALGLPPISPFPPTDPPASGNTFGEHPQGESGIPQPPSAAYEPAAMARDLDGDDDAWSSGADDDALTSSNSTLDRPPPEADRPAADRRKRRRLGSTFSILQDGSGSTDLPSADVKGVEGRGDHSAAEGGSSRSRGLMIGDALSRAPFELQERAIPTSCRNRVTACEDHPACAREQARASILMDFFGYGQQASEMITSQRFLWGKEELLWLGKRLQAAPKVPPAPPEDDRAFESSDEPSETLPGVMIGDMLSLKSGGG